MYIVYMAVLATDMQYIQQHATPERKRIGSKIL